MIDRDSLLNYLNELLTADKFNDYCPNGLQVEGKTAIKKVICAVTASQIVIDSAIEMEADAILVHHGFFWRGEDERINGMKKQRLAALLRHDINLFAYHLPLDVHQHYGNNIQLANQLAIDVSGNFSLMGIDNLGWLGNLRQPMSVETFGQHIHHQLKREPLIIAANEQIIKSIAWCSGGAQDGIIAAAKMGADAYLSGEVSERTYYQAKELNIHYIAAGHHATERGGVQALGQHLASEFDLSYQFVDSDNPV